MRGSVVSRIVERARIWPRVYNFGRRVLPGPVRFWIRTVVLRRSARVFDFEDLLLPSTAAPSGTPASVPPDTPYDVVYFPIVGWGFRFQRSQHLCAQFAKHGHRVYYVRPSFSPAEAATLREHSRRVYDLVLPGPRWLNVHADALDPRMTRRLVRVLSEFQKTQGLRDVVCVVALPFWGPLAIRLRQTLGWTLVYDCMDDHAGFPTSHPEMVRAEMDLVAHSDLVATTGRGLHERWSPHAARCVLIPNAADFDHFSTPEDAPPADVRTLPKPIIGYVGAIAEWFDSRLVAELAKERPRWSFVLIGSTEGSDVRALQPLPNVHLLGERPYAGLPGYCQHFDACIVPFTLNRLTEAADPVKVYEYLSAGKPVVTVPLPEVAPLVADGLAYEGRGAAAFLRALEQALSEDGPERRAARTAFARRHTWEARHLALRAAVAGAVPKSSIVIVTCNKAHLTALCLQSLWERTSYPNLEVIVVDNASQDDTAQMVQHMQRVHSNLRLIRNAENRGFAAATNQGLMASTGEILVLLNNDTVVTHGWLGGLVRHLSADRSIGMVGPVTNFSGNESRIEVSYASLEDMHVFAQTYGGAHAGETRVLPMLGMFCVAFRRDVLARVGLLDERFGVGMFEDDDYAWRVRALGYRMVCAEDIFVHHFGRSSIKDLDTTVYDTLFDRNRVLYERKWQTVWERHRVR